MTIFYSDLHNFTEVYNDSSPFEVCDEMMMMMMMMMILSMFQMVMMLNNYYKMFDDSMSKYQVYKVNCVNDSHMIVAGKLKTSIEDI